MSHGRKRTQRQATMEIEGSDDEHASEEEFICRRRLETSPGERVLMTKEGIVSVLGELGAGERVLQEVQYMIAMEDDWLRSVHRRIIAGETISASARAPAYTTMLFATSFPGKDLLIEQLKRRGWSGNKSGVYIPPSYETLSKRADEFQQSRAAHDRFTRVREQGISGLPPTSAPRNYEPRAAAAAAASVVQPRGRVLAESMPHLLSRIASERSMHEAVRNAQQQARLRGHVLGHDTGYGQGGAGAGAGAGLESGGSIDMRQLARERMMRRRN